MSALVLAKKSSCTLVISCLTREDQKYVKVVPYLPGL